MHAVMASTCTIGTMIERDHDPQARAGSGIRLLYGDCGFAEGPVWFGDQQCLIWSDIPNDRLLRWTPDGHIGTFRSPSNFANGNTRDRQGRLVTCEHMTRRVTRTELDGSVTVIADRYAGNRLNSPNDVVVRTDGTIWFTDPDYGLRQIVKDQPREQARDNVFRFDPLTGSLTVAVDDFVKPNGLAFSPDQSTLYIADSAVTEGPGYPSHIRSFRVRDDGTLAGGAVFATTIGVPDGMRVDSHGHLWASAGPGIDRYDPSGALLGRIGFPEDVTNLAFGHAGSRRMFVTAGHGLYAIDVDAQGAQWP
jgi:gluconolactonase